jgi:hypothetical protein
LEKKSFWLAALLSPAGQNPALIAEENGTTGNFAGFVFL